jgi:excisionase family DNA binding protein
LAAGTLMMDLVAAIERTTDTATPRSLSQLLGSLERLKAITWSRLLATAAPPERTPAEPLDDLRHLTPVQVAELLNLKEAYVHELCRSRQLPATKQGKYWIIPVAALREWLGRSRRGIDLGRSGSLPLAADRPGVSAPSTGSRDLKPEGGGNTAGRLRDPGARRFQHELDQHGA